MGAEVFHADRRQADMTKLIVDFRSFANAPSFLSSFLPSSRRYSPGCPLASSTISLNFSLYFIFSIHCFIFITFRSATTSSIHPSQTRSSFSSSYKQSSFYHLSWHRSLFLSLYMSQASYSLSFYKFHNILLFYGTIQFFIISNS